MWHLWKLAQASSSQDIRLFAYPLQQHVRTPELHSLKLQSELKAKQPNKAGIEEPNAPFNSQEEERMAAERKENPGKYRDQESDQHLCQGENMTEKENRVLGMVDSV